MGIGSFFRGVSDWTMKDLPGILGTDGGGQSGGRHLLEDRTRLDGLYNDMQGRPRGPRDVPVVGREDVAAPQDVAVPEMAPVERVQAQTVADPGRTEMQQATAYGYQGARVDDRQGQEVRSGQMSNVQALQDAAAGKGPSVAEERHRGALQDINNTALGIAAGARGPERGASKIAAMRTISEQTRRAASDLGANRAAEMLAARGQLTGALQGVRGQDDSIAATNAGFTQEANRDTSGRMTGVSQFNTGQANDGALKDKALSTSVAVGNADRTTSVGVGNADRSEKRTQFETGLQVDTANKNVDRSTTVAVGNADRGVKVQTTNTDAALKGRALDDQRASDADKDLLTASGQIQNNTGQQIQVEEGRKERAGKGKAGVVSGVATGVASGISLLSDERTKHDIKPIKKRDFKEFAAALKRASANFEYTDPSNGEGENYGLIAQELEKSKIGATTVEDVGGRKRINVGRLAAALAAYVGNGGK